MKYYNKHPIVRKRYWTRVELAQEDHSGMYPPGVKPFKGWYRRDPFDKMKAALQNTPSHGKFYMMILKREVWFESAEDAVYFKLKFGV
jgi:hypothetical protein